jgi:hypothetical protein
MRVGFRRPDYLSIDYEAMAMDLLEQLVDARHKLKEAEREIDLLATENERLLDLLQELEDGGPPIPQYRHPPEDRDAEPSRD